MSFDDALVDVDSIRRFLAEVVEPLRRQEAELAPQWRSIFRSKLPFFELLSGQHQTHLRGIFAHLLPPAGVDVDGFDRDARVLLDVLSETYLEQAGIFVKLAEEFQYEVVPRVHRSAPGRIVALSLSGSVFVLDAQDGAGRRRYRYQNIYGNQRVDAEGRCRMKVHLRLFHPIRTSVFHSSPLLLLAVHPKAMGFRLDFSQESRSVSMTLSSRLREASLDASETFQGYTNVIPFSGGEGEGEGQRVQTQSGGAAVFSGAEDREGAAEDREGAAEDREGAAEDREGEEETPTDPRDSR